MFFLLGLPAELEFEPLLAPTHQEEPRGQKGFDPKIMALLLLYAYCVGIAPSRRIERAFNEVAAFALASLKFARQCRWPGSFSHTPAATTRRRSA